MDALERRPAGRVRVKICGVTVPEDGLAAAAAGADAIGAVFSPGFAPSVSVAEGAEIFRRLPPFVTRVALLVDPSAELVREVAGAAAPGALQFHGDETEDFCASFGLPYVKACRVKGASDIIRAMEGYRSACGILLDGFSRSAPGGTGVRFDWTLARQADFAKPIIVAGGLTPENVAAAVAECEPYGVDVSSGVSAEGDRRRKDPAKVGEFIANARS